MKLMTIRYWLWGIIVAMTVGFDWQSSAQQKQEVLVVVCQYLGTNEPVLSSQQWANQLNERLNAYYRSATQGMVEFDFVPVPEVLEFDFTYESTDGTGYGETPEERLYDDPFTIPREGRLAVIHARESFPDKFSDTVWVVTVVNRHRRGRAVQPTPFPIPDAPSIGLWADAAVMVISDPLAPLLKNRNPPELSSQLSDLDGDQLSNVDESLFNGDALYWDTDLDYLSDWREANETMTALDLADTDGDGFSDWDEVTLDTSDPLSPDILRLPDGTISLVAHELGHNLGLPDLYADERYFTTPSYGPWGIMATHALQNFSAFSRREKRWHDPTFGQRVIDVGPAGVGAQTFLLVEPQRALVDPSMPQNVTDLIRIRRHFYPEVLLEARPKLFNDETRESIGSTKLGDIVGLPEDYQAGVLMSQVDARFEESGSDVRYAFGEPIAKIIPHFGDDDPGPDRGPFASVDATVNGPGRLMVRLSVDKEESQVEFGIDGTVVESLLETLDEDDDIDDQTVFIPVGEGSHQFAMTHSAPFDPVGEFVGSTFVSDIRLQVPPRILIEPSSVVTGPTGRVDIAFAFESDAPDTLNAMLQRQAGTDVWNDDSSVEFLPGRIRFRDISTVDSGVYRVQLADAIGLVRSESFTLEVLDPVAEAIKIKLGATGMDWESSSNLYLWSLSAATPIVRSPSDIPVGFPLSLTASIEGPVVVQFDWSSLGAVFDYYVNDVLEASIDLVPNESRETVLGPGQHRLRWIFRRDSSMGIGSIGPVRTVRTPSIVGHPRPKATDVGGTVTFRVSVASTDVSETTFQWYKDGAPMAGANGASLTLSPVAESDAGLYSVRVGSLPGLGAVDSESAELRIKPEVTENLFGARFFDFNIEAWSTESNSEGWLGEIGFVRSQLMSPGLENAPIQAGETYTDRSGLVVTVGDFDETQGSYEVTVRSDPPPIFSDLEILGGWLDSHEFNGAGAYMFGVSGEFGDPNLGGDPVFVRRRPFIDFSGPLPVPNYQNITSRHRVSFRVKNVGLGPAEDIQGTIFFLPPHIFLGPLLFDYTSLSRNRLADLAFDQEAVEIRELGVAETTVVSALINPEGPFQAVLLLDRVENEAVFWNNSYQSVFWFEFTLFGSPYKPVDLDLDFENVTPFKHTMFPRLTGIPQRWGANVVDPTTGVAKLGVSLDPGSREAFQIHIEPPEPALHKPGTPVQVGVEGWMDVGDTFVPIGEIPIVIVPTHPTEVSLDLKLAATDAALSGQLRYVPLSGVDQEGVTEVLASALVAVEVVGSDGSFQEKRVTTGQAGDFVTVFESQLGVVYYATAHYNGSASYHPAESSLLEWGELGENPIRQITFSRTHISENVDSGIAIGELTAEGGSGALEYELALGPGDEDNARFFIRGHRLILDGSVDYELDPKLSFRVRATDADSNASREQFFEIQVNDKFVEDADGDGLIERLEHELGTSDHRLDSDGDGYSDLFEVGLDVDPADPEQVPVSYWKEARRIEFENPIAARWSELDQRIYVGRRNVEGQDGLYRIEKDDRVTFVAVGDRVSGVVVVPDERAIFFAEDFAGEVNRVEMVLVGRDPPSANAAQRWVSTFHAGDDDPMGLAWAPRNDKKSVVPSGHVVVVDRGNNGPDEIWTFDPASTNSEIVLHRDDDTLRDAVDVAIGEEAVYVLDAAGVSGRQRIFRVGARGILSSVPLYGLEGSGRGLVVDPISEELLMMLNGDDESRIHRINPITGAHRVELGGFSANASRSCLALSDDGNQLFVTDFHADLVLVYDRVYLVEPEIHSFEPKYGAAGDLIQLSGRGLAEIAEVWVGGVPQEIESNPNPFRLEFRLSPETTGGRIRVQTLAGEVESTGVIRLPQPPGEIRLSEAVVSLTQVEGAVVGRLEVVDPDPGDRPTFNLLPFESFPDNRFYRIDGVHLVLGERLLANEVYRHRVGIRAVDRFGLSATQDFVLTLASPPQLTRQPRSVVVDSGQVAQFEVGVEGSPDLTVRWFGNGELIEGADQLQLLVTEVTSAETGEYLVEVRNPFGAVLSEPALLSLHSLLEDVRILSISLRDEGIVSLEIEILGQGSNRLGLEWSDNLEIWNSLEDRTFKSGIRQWQFPLIEDEPRANFRIVERP